jgi:cardiolipin synthase
MVHRSSFAVSALLFLSLLTVAGCGKGSSSNDGGGNSGGGGSTPAPQSMISATSLTFASTSIGLTSAAQTVTVTNTGTATLSILNGSPVLSDTTNYKISASTCLTSLAENSSCTFNVTFTPATAVSVPATIAFTDNSGNVTTPHTITLSGTGLPVSNATATLSETSLTFGRTTINTTTASQSVTLTNNGATSLTGISITKTGTNASVFNVTNTCSSSLAYNTSCTISVTFSPAASGTDTATINIADSATGSPQTIALAGTAVNPSTTTYTLYSFPDPDPQTGKTTGALTALYALVNNALTSIDMTMYALNDTTFTTDLVNACKRGVTVRVVLDQNSEMGQDGPAYAALNAQTNCSAVWANKAFAVTHEKCIVVDGAVIALLSANLQTQYYTTTRDFAMIYDDAADAAAIEATFAMDYAAGTPASGVAGASDFSYLPGPGSGDLIWSPTTAKDDMEAIINGATTTLRIDNEELYNSASYITTDIRNACKRGVSTYVTIENQSHTNDTQLTALKTDCNNVRYYFSSTGFYVHAKVVVADYGLPTQNAYMGSINYSNASMTQNRELGMFVTDNASVALLNNSLIYDYNNATVY